MFFEWSTNFPTLIYLSIYRQGTIVNRITTCFNLFTPDAIYWTCASSSYPGTCQPQNSTNMASKSEGGGKDDINFIKDKFTTREGTYILAHWSEYTKPTRLQTSGSTNTPVRASFINVSGDPSPERICFNIGKELYVYVYKGVKKVECQCTIMLI